MKPQPVASIVVNKAGGLGFVGDKRGIVAYAVVLIVSTEAEEV